MHPEVSIVLPTYNGSKYIRQSIDSCLKQTFKDFELIIVDDCSKEDIYQIIKSCNDPRIRYHRNETNQRLPRSLNIGFSLTKGKYLTWTSDDNFYLPPAIEKMIKILKEQQCEFVYTDIYALYGNNDRAAKPETLNDVERLNQANCIRACFLYTRKVMTAIGEYDPDMELIEDYDYWVRVSKQFDMYHLKEPLYYYRYHDQQLYTARNQEIKIIEFLFKTKYDFLPMDKVNWEICNLWIQRSRGAVSFLKKIFTKIYHRPKINKILKEYKAGKLTFTASRQILNKLING